MTEEQKMTVDANEYSRTHALLTAWLCLQQPQFVGATVLTKAKWLMSMGLSRADAATLVGSTEESIRVMASVEAKKALKAKP